MWKGGIHDPDIRALFFLRQVIYNGYMKREIFIGKVGIGGGHRVSIQSMTSTDTHDAEATLLQIRKLSNAGCDIIRVAIPDGEALAPFRLILQGSPLPVVADIHFDAMLAIKAIEAGAHGIRINPGNIGDNAKVRDILSVASEHGVPIRIGVNSGSIEKKYRDRFPSRAEAMAASVMDKVKFFEDHAFTGIKISVKSPDVRETVTAYRLIDKSCDYPLHIGVTEAGTKFGGTVKSVLGIGALLLDGIGDTIRVSLTEDPVEEIRVAREILKVVGLRREGVEFISCPTCSRTSVDLIGFAREAEEKLAALHLAKPVTVAVMGCEVNGPGEAIHADIGLAFSKNWGYIFRDGALVEKVAPQNAVARLVQLTAQQFSL